MASDRVRATQHAFKIILGALLSRTLDVKIARLVLIFHVVLVLYAPPPPKKAFHYNSFRNNIFIVIETCFELGSLEMIV